MEIHVSASLTMRSNKAIKEGKKRGRRGPRSVCHCRVYWLMTKKTIERSSTAGAGGDRQGEFHFLSQIFRNKTCSGISASHFSYCITLIKGLPGSSSEPCVTVTFWGPKGGKKTPKRHPLEICLSWQRYQLSCLEWSRPLHYLEINS